MSAPAVQQPARFELTAEQRALRETAREFADEQLAPHALEWDANQTFPVHTVRSAGSLGLGGVCVAEDVGGSALTRFDSVVIYEALATGDPCVAAYLSIHNMVASLLDRFGSEQQRQEWLPDLCAMRRLASYCLTEPDAGSDAAALSTRARPDGEDYVLSGVKQFISGGGDTDLYLVMARTGDAGASGISAFLVDGNAAGISFGPNERKMGWHAQSTRQVVFEGVRVPATQRLGAEGDGFKVAMAGLDAGRLGISACSVGGAHTALTSALEHAGQRTAFASPIADFQAVRFKLADMATDLEAARLMLWRAASALDTRDAKATRWCAMAKRFATDTGFAVANEALQIHGGYGYLAEYGVEKLVRDLRVHQILEGTNEIMRLIIARDLLENVS